MAESKAWFGRKRIGWGYRPQTWQGWALILVPVVVVIVVVALVH